MAKALAATPLAAIKRRRETDTDTEADLLFDAAQFRENRFCGGFISVEPMPVSEDVND
jgi:hypothetical protein